MGCGASAPVAHDPVANVAAALGAPPAKTTIEPLATPEDVVEFSVVPAESNQPPSAAQNVPPWTLKTPVFQPQF
jgi:hypothetical protein